MRAFIFALLIFFSVTPLAFAQGLPPGSSCTSDSQCQSGHFCDPMIRTCSGTFTGQPTPVSDGTTPSPAQSSPSSPTPQPSPIQSTGNTIQTQSTGNTVNNNVAGSNVTLINPLKSGTSLESFLGNILQFVVRIGAIIVVLMLIFVGFKFVMAQGAPGEIEKAKGMLLWTVIGALVLLGAQAISMGILATVQALGG